MTIRFTNGAEVERVTATFAHKEDRNIKFVLSGIPNRQGEDNWLAVLSGRVTDANKRGVYEWEQLEAEYPGGQKDPFRVGSLEAALFIKDRSIQAPAATGWHWGAM
jgi:hypothetical protein